MLKEKHSTRDADEILNMKSVSADRPQGVMCKVRGLFHDLGMRNSGQ